MSPISKSKKVTPTSIRPFFSKLNSSRVFKMSANEHHLTVTAHFQRIIGEMLESIDEEDPAFNFISTISIAHFKKEKKFWSDISYMFVNKENHKIEPYLVSKIQEALDQYLRELPISQEACKQVIPPLSEEDIPTIGEAFVAPDDDGESPCESDDQETNFNCPLNEEHPNVPGVPCPNQLFVSLIRQKYINSLYETNPEAFPKKWKRLLRNDPEQAWHSLNQTIIPYLNNRYPNQGLDIKSGETTSTYLSTIDLESRIINALETCTQNKRTEEKQAPKSTKDSAIKEMKDLSIELNKLAKHLNSLLTKISGCDLKNPPLFSPQSAGISSGQQQLTSQIKSTELKSKEKDSLDELFGGF